MPSWTHRDDAFATWAFSFCCGREYTPATLSVGHDSAYGLRSTTRNADTTAQEVHPVGGGANFVDLNMKVVVKQAAGTLMIFKPEHLHGTTKSCGASHNFLFCTRSITHRHNYVGAVNHAITYAFSTRIKDAFLKAVAKRDETGSLGKVESQEGAGEGNSDKVNEDGDEHTEINK